VSSTEIATASDFVQRDSRPSAVVQDYNYSVALKALHRTRTPTVLDAYLADPPRDIHGVQMHFNRLPPEPQQDRTGVIAYLESLQTD
jgi:cytochrome c